MEKLRNHYNDLKFKPKPTAKIEEQLAELKALEKEPASDQGGIRNQRPLLTNQYLEEVR